MDPLRVSNHPGCPPMWSRINGGRSAHHVVSYAPTQLGGSHWSQVKSACGLWGQTHTASITSTPRDPKCKRCVKLSEDR